MLFREMADVEGKGGFASASHRSILHTTSSSFAEGAEKVQRSVRVRCVPAAAYRARGNERVTAPQRFAIQKCEPGATWKLLRVLHHPTAQESPAMQILTSEKLLPRRQHLAFDKERNHPLPNLFVSLLQRLGIGTDKFATATGAFKGLELA